jgi:CHAT domain-containing protein
VISFRVCAVWLSHSGQLRFAQAATVYNLHVESKQHTFFADGVLVHNAAMKEVLHSILGSGGGPSSPQLDEIRQKIGSLSDEINEIELLRDRLDLLEFKVDQMSRAFETIGNSIRRTTFVPRNSTARHTNQARARANIEIDDSITDFNEKEQRRLIDTIARQTRTNPSEIQLLTIVPGSVLVTLEMPEDSALRLMSLYLSGHSIITELRIQKVELRPLLTASSPLRLEAPTLIRILFLASNPTDTPRLRLDEEVRSIEHALRLAEFRDKFEIVQCWATRVTDMQACLLRHRPIIVHFSGHGNPVGEIVLQDETGRTAPAHSRALGSIFRILRDNIKCVVLNACYSEVQAQAIAAEVDCVVGMTTTIGDASAVAFATAFYQALGYGRDIKAAFDLGCAQIDLQALPDPDVPKLISLRRDPSTLTFVT